MEDCPANQFERVSSSITDVDADYDNESDQVEQRVGVRLLARGERNSVTARNVGFNVTTLASMQQH